MPHISKKKVNANIERVLGDQLLTFLSAVRSKHDAAVIASELLTDTERTMLAKRLATVIMLERRYSFSEIEETLQVTPQTVARLWRRRVEGGFYNLSRYARDHTKHFRKGNTFIKTLEDLLTISGASRIKRQLLSKSRRRLSE